MAKERVRRKKGMRLSLMKLWVTIWMWLFEEQGKAELFGRLPSVLGQVLGIVSLGWAYIGATAGFSWTVVCIVLGWF